MISKEDVKMFLEDEEREGIFIKQLSEKYSLSDFIKVDRRIKNCYDNNETKEIGSISGCIFDCRENFLCLNIDLVEGRLTKEYLEFVMEVIEDNEIDKVLYIVIFHYLSLCKQQGYLFTIADNAPFPFIGDKLSPLGEDKLDEYKEFYNKFSLLSKFVYEEYLTRFNRLFLKYGYQHGSTKHFSLLGCIEGKEHLIDTFMFDNIFVDMLDLFVFRYKAIYTTENIYRYMNSETQEKIVNSLIDL